MHNLRCIYQVYIMHGVPDIFYRKTYQIVCFHMTQKEWHKLYVKNKYDCKWDN